MAEAERFELSVGYTRTPVFKTGAFNRSAKLPIHEIRTYNSLEFMVHSAGIEPARAQCPRDFKSLVSTYFTTSAFV